VAVAGAIRGCLRRAGEFAARLGGEEFAVLLPGSDSASALALGETIRLAVRGLAVKTSTSFRQRHNFERRCGDVGVRPHRGGFPGRGSRPRHCMQQRQQGGTWLGRKGGVRSTPVGGSATVADQMSCALSELRVHRRYRLVSRLPRNFSDRLPCAAVAHADRHVSRANPLV